MAPAEKSLLLPYLVDGPHLSTTISQPTCSARCPLPGTINSTKNKSTSSHSYFFFFFSACVLAKKKKREGKARFVTSVYLFPETINTQRVYVSINNRPLQTHQHTHTLFVCLMATTSGERAFVLVSSYSTATGTIHTHTAGGIKTHSDKTHCQTLAKKKCNVCC